MIECIEKATRSSSLLASEQHSLCLATVALGTAQVLRRLVDLDVTCAHVVADRPALNV